MRSYSTFDYHNMTDITHLVLYCCMLYKCNQISGRSQNVEMVGGGRGGLPYMEVAPGTFLKIYYCLPPTSSAPLSVSSFDIHYEPFYLSLSSVHTCMFCFGTFLFRSARTSCTTPGWPVCLSAMKIWIPCIQAYKYASSPADSSNQPNGPWDPPDAPLTPWDP